MSGFSSCPSPALVSNYAYRLATTIADVYYDCYRTVGPQKAAIASVRKFPYWKVRHLAIEPITVFNTLILERSYGVSKTQIAKVPSFRW